MRVMKPWYQARDFVPGARVRFEAWLEAGPGVDRLLLALEHREWRDDPETPRHDPHAFQARPMTSWRLTPVDAVRIEAAIIRRVEAAGGRVELGATVAEVIGGELRITMR